MFRFLAVFVAVIFCLHSFSQTTPVVNIIPKPVSLKVKPGSFKLNSNTKLVVKDQGDIDAANFFNDYLQKYYDIKLDIADAAENNFISFNTKKFIKAPENDEHYTLNGNAKSISIDGDSTSSESTPLYTHFTLSFTFPYIPSSIKSFAKVVLVV